MSCEFCNNQEIRNRVIYKDSLVWTFPTNIPIVPGHLLICPVRCVAKIDDLKPEELKAITDLIIRLKKILKETFGAQGFHCAFNEGKIAGQSVNHLHFHLVPRKDNDHGITDYEPRKFLYRPGSRNVSPEEELREVTNLIKTKLN